MLEILFLMIALALSAGIIYLSLPLWLLVLTKREIGFVSPKGGEAIRIDRFNTPLRWVMHDPEKHLNGPSDTANYDPTYPAWEILPNKWKEQGTGTDRIWVDTRSKFNQKGVYGFFWPFERVHYRKFSWIELDQSAGSAQARPRPRTESVGSIFIKRFQYYASVSRVMLSGGVTYDIHYLITVEGTNPWTADVKNDNWLAQVIGATDICVKNYAGAQTPDELRTETDAAGAGPIQPLALGLNDEIPDPDHAGSFLPGLPRFTGFRLVKIKLYSIVDTDDPEGKKAEIQRKKWEADQLAIATRTTGQAEADVIEMKGAKEAAAELAVGTAKAEVILKQGQAQAVADDLIFEAKTKTEQRTRVAVAEQFGKIEVLSVGKSGINMLLEKPNKKKEKTTTEPKTAEEPEGEEE